MNHSITEFRATMRTVSRMRLGQVVYRFIRLCKQKFVYRYFGKLLFRQVLVGKEKIRRERSFIAFTDWSSLSSIHHTDIEESVSCAEQAILGRFRFLNSDYVDLGLPIDWGAQRAPDELWRFNLHYFEYLYDLALASCATQDRRFVDGMIYLVQDWIDKNSVGSGVAWEPYTVSRRLESFIFLWRLLVNDPSTNQEFKRKIVSSIATQARFLSRNLELDLRNNHLTANGKALFLVGVTLPFLPQAARWVERGIRILDRQLRDEVQEDGAQYENSTSYQMVTILDYLTVLVTAEKCLAELPGNFSRTVETMIDWFLTILRPDGSIPLLNDSVQGYPLNSSDLLAIAAVYFNRPDLKFGTSQDANLVPLWRLLGADGVKRYQQLPEKRRDEDGGAHYLENSGLFIYRKGHGTKQTYLLFDVGPIGPEHCCGHAHADNLSIELFAHGREILVDPGTFEYGNGPKRNYYRSTEAHNTIEIEHQNQTTFWGAFRVDHIARTKVRAMDTESNRFSVAAEHDGYLRLPQRVLHQRTISSSGTDSFLVEDCVTGKGEINGALNFTIGPKCKKVDVAGQTCVLHFGDGLMVTIEFDCSQSLDVRQRRRWISRTWKSESSCLGIRAEFTGQLPVHITTSIRL